MKSTQTDTFFFFAKNAYICSAFFGMDPSLQKWFQNGEFPIFRCIHRKFECLEFLDRVDENILVVESIHLPLVFRNLQIESIYLPLVSVCVDSIIYLNYHLIGQKRFFFAIWLGASQQADEDILESWSCSNEWTKSQMGCKEVVLHILKQVFVNILTDSNRRVGYYSIMIINMNSSGRL